ncbi:MAG: hypothetical protein IAE97_00340 [Chthoniobacterales bacterium]|nr:hypothetical protein [Chthoniobacterales bacterium]
MKTPIIYKGEAIAGPLPLFQPEMRRANRDGRKRQTRRIVRLPKAPGLEFRFDGAWKDGGPGSPFEAGEYLHMQFRCLADGPDGWGMETFDRVFCPLALPGDLRYMREPLIRIGGFAWYADDETPAFSLTTGQHIKWRWRRDYLPHMFMPAEAARWFARIGNIRVERLQDINGQDAIAEGIESFRRDVSTHATVTTFRDYLTGATDRAAIQSFQTLWQSINGPDSWQENRWVWVIGYSEVT